MTIRELCEKIELQDEARREVLSFAEAFDFSGFENLLEELRNPKTWDGARKELEKQLAPDEKQFKMLACMLKCAAEDYESYRKQCISDEIYTDTMKCFPRFIKECREKTGKYAFDRAFWTVRQIGMQLFRIGTLEYEKTELDGRPVISIHIPSDADLTPEVCDASLKQAAEFWKDRISGNDPGRFVCSSWLLAPPLRKLLPADSKIIRFQDRFRLIYENPDSTEYLTWVYQTEECRTALLPEHTTLQKRMKEYLLSGGKVGDALGVLKNGITDYLS